MRFILSILFVSHVSAFLWPPYYGFTASPSAADVVENQVKTVQLTFKNNDLELFGDLFGEGEHSANEDIVKDLFAVFSASDSLQVKNAQFIYNSLNDISADIKLFKGGHHVRTAQVQMKKAPGSPTNWKINKVDLVEHHSAKDHEHHHHHNHRLPTQFF